MLIDENDVFMTQREFPQMALFRLTPENDGFKIVRGRNSIFLSVNPSGESPEIHSDVWGSPVSIVEVSEQHSQWFSKELGLKCRLVAFPEANRRPVDPAFASRNEQVSLADGFPLLVIGQASLDDLNSRLKDPVPMNRFRPNLVFTGGRPYEEDVWSNFAIGANRFRGVKPCSRCVMTTVNQDTGVKGVEPLTTLATYRKKEDGVYFGQNVLAIDHKEIHEGDEINLG